LRSGSPPDRHPESSSICVVTHVFCPRYGAGNPVFVNHKTRRNRGQAVATDVQ
jgi:hypothetical protein